MLGAVICLASGVSMNPVEWFKGQVVSHYDKTYGKDAKKKIWEDLGGFYNTKKGAMTDFNDHR